MLSSNYSPETGLFDALNGMFEAIFFGQFSKYLKHTAFRSR